MHISEFSMNLFSLDGKNAIITGGNSGLGLAFSVALAKAGANVFVPSITTDVEEVKTLVEGEGRRFEFLETNITEPGACKTIVDTCIERLGSVDIIVNCAGICNLGDVDEFDRAKWDPMIAINLTAAFELSYEAMPHMRTQGHGKIINIASLFSFLGGQWSPAYAATKHGIVGFTKAYCDELAQYNIQVNAIAPGYFATKITEATRSNPVTNQRVLDHIPANRWGDVADLMGACVFLASNASDYVNGHTLTVDGGYLVR
ncbi:SDR family oxidoreductase [Schaalia sp. ZJ1691]|uniref:SDR family oxidoreductase n=1 Tax=Schaalia sp. ZJ1691 TaxID=2709404 RepID=UPI0013EB68FA|nr:SDR family oxidoreductase [Schaalia sp. ZJ1691]